MASPSQPAFLVDARILPTVIYWIERGVHPAAAARKAGVKESDLESWLERGRAGKEPCVDFAEQVDKALNDYEMKLSGVIHEAATRIDRPDVSAAKWALERRFPKHWRPKDDVVPVVPQKPDGKAYSVEELRSAADLQEAAAARARARVEAERKGAS